jgi:ubiquinone/menaquinone biosynthesis C-methylase UbiE
MTVVDYGCGPGRYTIRFARLVGANGRVFEVDLRPLAMRMVEQTSDHLKCPPIK